MVNPEFARIDPIHHPSQDGAAKQEKEDGGGEDETVV
jgi:hypothetical protein